MDFSPNVIQVLQKIIDQHLQHFSNDKEERTLLIKCQQELGKHAACAHHVSRPNQVPLLYSRRK
jgi:hypothetical protein